MPGYPLVVAMLGFTLRNVYLVPVPHSWQSSYNPWNFLSLRVLTGVFCYVNEATLECPLLGVWGGDHRNFQAHPDPRRGGGWHARGQVR